MFCEAFDQIGKLDFLFFVGPHKDAKPEETASLIAKTWRINRPRVFIERYGDDPGMSRLVTDYLLPIASIRRQARYARMSGAEQVAIVERYLAHQPDLVFAHRLEAMCPLLLTKRPTPPILFDLDDIEHKAKARSISKPPEWKLKRLQYLHLPALWLGERRAIRKSDTTFVCSAKDRGYLSRIMRTSNVEVLPNTVRTPPAIQPASLAPPNILFLGSYGYPPNALAGDILIRQIWPRVRERVPEARLLIAGGNPQHITSYIEPQAGVEFTGFVDDLDVLYARSRVVCTPIQNGGGTRIKIIEAAMYARPVVSTKIGAEGLNFRPGKEILIADDVDRLAEMCINLLLEPERCDSIGAEAMQAATRCYGRETATKTIVDAAKKLLAGTKN